MRAWRTWILVCAAALVVLVCYLLIAGQRQDGSAIVAFETDAAHNQRTICVYNQKTSARRAAISNMPTDTGIIGYDSQSDTWILDSGNCTLGEVVESHQGKLSHVRLEDFPNDGDHFNLSLSNGILIIPTIRSARLAVYGYDLNGTLKWTRILKVPKHAIEGYDGKIALTRDGSIAVCLVMKDTLRSELCIFNSAGKLVRAFSSGTNPAYSPDGRYLIFIDCRLKRDRLGGQTVESNTGAIFIYDTKAKTKRKIAASTPPGISRVLAIFGSMPDDYQWSGDGKHLICAYPTWLGESPFCTLYSIKVTSSVPRWKKLHLVVYRGWISLDKAPPASN